MADPARRSERRWAVLRVALGQAQMIGGVVSLVLLVGTGLSEFMAWAVVITCACLVSSRLLFRAREG